MTKLRTVLQSDRDSAASVIQWMVDVRWLGVRNLPEEIRNGTWDDHPIVQRFARHREAAA